MSQETLIALIITIPLTLTAIAVVIGFYVDAHKRRLKVRKAVSIHECGHLMLLVCYKPVPRIIYVFLNLIDRGFKVGGSGHVYRQFDGLDDNCVINMQETRYAMMLNLLAGYMAEHQLTLQGGRLTADFSLDLIKWQSIAKVYLGEYYSDSTAVQLRLTQEMILKRFFKANQEILIKLSDLLFEKGELYYSDVQPYLDTITLVDGLPVINITNHRAVNALKQSSEKEVTKSSLTNSFEVENMSGFTSLESYLNHNAP